MALLTPDLGFIFWHSVILLISLLILSRYAWKPILAAIKAREDVYQQAMLEVRKAKEEMAQLETKKEAMMEEAHAQSDLIIQKAMANKEALLEAAEEEATKAKQRIMAEAHQSIALEQEQARTAVKAQTVALVLHTTEKLIAQQLVASPQQQKLIEQMMEEVETEENP